MKRVRLLPSILALSEIQQRRLAWFLLGLSMLVYAVVMSHLTILRYDTFKATAFDLGNMDQAVWNTLHGRPFVFTNQGADWYGPSTRLAQHVEPIILPLSLLYIFGADPRILLVFQTLALMSGALPVFLLTRKYIPIWPLFAAVMSIAYLFTPALLGVNIFDFHPVSLATPLLLYAVLALTHRRYIWFLVACVLAAACKEEIPLVIALFGILVIWKYRLPRLGTALIIGGVLWSGLAFGVIMPHFYPGTQHNNFWYRYEMLGATPKDAMINVLLHPWILVVFITLDRIYYLGNLCRSTGFFALLAPEWLLPALPSLAITLLSTDPLLYSGVYHYNAAVIPFIMLAAIHGARRAILVWQGWREEKAWVVPRGKDAIYAHNESATETPVVGTGEAAVLSIAPVSSKLEALVGSVQQACVRLLALRTVVAHAVATHPTLSRPVAFVQPCLSTFASGRVQQWRNFNGRLAGLAHTMPVLRLQRYVYIWIIAMCVLNYCVMTPQLNIFWATREPGSREQHIQQLLAMIPPDASVAAGNNLNPHLTERQYVTVFPQYYITTARGKVPVNYIIVDLDAVFPEDKVTTANVLNQLQRSKLFRLLASAEGVVLLVRNNP